MEDRQVSEFIVMAATLIGLVVVLISLIIIVNEREMDREFPLSRRKEKARLMSEEYRR